MGLGGIESTNLSHFIPFESPLMFGGALSFSQSVVWTANSHHMLFLITWMSLPSSRGGGCIDNVSAGSLLQHSFVTRNFSSQTLILKMSSASREAESLSQTFHEIANKITDSQKIRGCTQGLHQTDWLNGHGPWFCSTSHCVYLDRDSDYTRH